MPTADEWLQRLVKLRQHGAAHNPAPHKPLLLLAILEAAEQSGPVASRLELTPELFASAVKRIQQELSGGAS